MNDLELFSNRYKTFENQVYKPRLYEENIDFDRLRMYRLNRVLEQLRLNNVGACILFDPINIRYATDSRNMSLFTMHELVRFVFISAEGKVMPAIFRSLRLSCGLTSPAVQALQSHQPTLQSLHRQSLTLT